VISSPNRSARGKAPVSLVIIHTAEGARTVTSLGNYFASAAIQASSHVGIDDTGIEQYVPYTEAAWTTRAANPISDNAELCGFAAWTRGQWLTEHHPMLERTAAWIRERCLARGIPIRKLTPDQVGAGMTGVCGHFDWTVGMKDGSHTDPGPGFPWDVVMGLAAGSTPTPSPTPRVVASPEDDPMSPIDIDVHSDGSFRAAAICEAGASSSVVAQAWVAFGVTWGSADCLISFLGDDGLVMGAAGQKRGQVTNNRRLVADVPSGAVLVTVEGQCTNGSVPTAAILSKPKP
jgi:hypothetical protein